MHAFVTHQWSYRPRQGSPPAWRETGQASSWMHASRAISVQCAMWCLTPRRGPSCHAIAAGCWCGHPLPQSKMDTADRSLGTCPFALVAMSPIPVPLSCHVCAMHFITLPFVPCFYHVMNSCLYLCILHWPCMLALCCVSTQSHRT